MSSGSVELTSMQSKVSRKSLNKEAFAVHKIDYKSNKSLDCPKRFLSKEKVASDTPRELNLLDEKKLLEQR